MRKLISTFAALIAVSCAPTPVLADKPEPIPCAKLAHYTLLVVDDSVSSDALGSWVRRQQFSPQQLHELRGHNELLAALFTSGLSQEDARRLPEVVFEVCMEERGI